MAHGRNGRSVLGLGAHVAMIDGFGALATLPQVPQAMRGGQQISAKRLLRANTLAVRDAQRGGRAPSTMAVATNRPVAFVPPGREEQRGPLARRLAVESKTAVARLRYGRPAPGGAVTVSAVQRQHWARFGNWPGKFFGTKWPDVGLGAYEVGGETYEYAKDLDALGRDPGPPTRVPPEPPPAPPGAKGAARWMKDLSIARAEFSAFRIWRAAKSMQDEADFYFQKRKLSAWRAAPTLILLDYIAPGAAQSLTTTQVEAGAPYLAEVQRLVGSIFGKQRYVLKLTRQLYAAGYGPMDPATDYVAGAIHDAFKELTQLAKTFGEGVDAVYKEVTDTAKAQTAFMDRVGFTRTADFLHDTAELPGKLLDAARNAARGLGGFLGALGPILKWGLPVALLGVGGYVVYRYARRGKRLLEAVT